MSQSGHNKKTKKYTLRRRLFIVLSTYIVMSLAFFAIIIYAFNQIKKVEQVNAMIFEVHEHLEEIETSRAAMIGASLSGNRSAETNNLEKKYQDELGTTRELIQQAFGNQFFRQAIETSLTDSFLQCFSDYLLFNDTLAGMVDQVIQVEHSLSGSLNGYTATLENLEDHAYINSLNEIIAAEEKYLIQHNETFFNTIGYNLNNLMFSIEDLDLEPSQKTQISAALNQYESRLGTLRQLHRQLGLLNGEGLLAKLSQMQNRSVTLIETMMAEFSEYQKKIIAFNIIGFAIIAVLSIFFVSRMLLRIMRFIRSQFHLLTQTSSALALGDIPNEIPIPKMKSELSVALDEMNKMIKALHQTVDFANSIKDKKFDFEYKTLSNRDKLGNALLEMRESLVKAQTEAEERRKQEEQTSWINIGTAKFAEILNQNYTETAEFAFSIISNLVKYLNANQGGFLYSTTMIQMINSSN